MDGVCDDDDVCPEGDDTIDGDMDGAPDACDICPLDNPDDGDMDGVCDTDDLCPEGDDDVDGDMDGAPDACDICPAGDDGLDVNMDGIPDACAVDVLIVDGYGSGDLSTYLESWGFTTTIVNGGVLDANYDYSDHDVVAVMYNSPFASPATLDAEIVAGNVGLVVHRGDALVDDFGMGTSGFWQDGEFSIEDNTHFISEPFAVGPLPLDYTYKSDLIAPANDVTVLGSVSGPSLVVHDVYRKVVTPYYGHTDGMPWNDAGAEVTWRSYLWAAGVGAQ